MATFFNCYIMIPLERNDVWLTTNLLHGNTHLTKKEKEPNLEKCLFFSSVFRSDFVKNGSLE